VIGAESSLVLRHSTRQSVVGGLLPDPRWISVGLPLTTTLFDKVPRSQLPVVARSAAWCSPWPAVAAREESAEPTTWGSPVLAGRGDEGDGGSAKPSSCSLVLVL
jgi:hypothetical protein